MTRSIRIAVATMMAAALVAGGCAKKKQHTLDETTSTYGPGGGGESGLASGGSLDRFKRGLGPEEGGVLKDVHFAFDRYDLDATARDILAANAEWLKDNPRARTEIEDHCDERGTVEYNLALGERRAKATQNYLAAHGVEAARVSIVSYGKERPQCAEANEACWAKNRRAHFLVKAQ